MITDENDKLSSRLSLLIISSPAKSHPSLFLLESVFQSIIKCLPEINLFKIPIIVILDGYHIIDKGMLYSTTDMISYSLNIRRYRGKYSAKERKDHKCLC